MNVDHDQDKIRQERIIILGGDFISYYYGIDSRDRKIWLDMDSHPFKGLY
jgi:hypothetical protein